MPTEEELRNDTWTNPPPWNRSTTNHVIGGAAFGLATRMWQLGILKKPLSQNPIAHGASILAWSFIGYWVWRWDIRSKELIAEKRVQLAARQGAVKGL